MELGKFAPVVAEACSRPRRVCVAGAGSPDVLTSVAMAAAAGLVSECLLVGDPVEIRAALHGTGRKLEGKLVPAAPHEVGIVAARLTGAGEADVLVKGKITSSEFLRAVLDREAGLRGDSILSHVAILEIPALDYLVGVTDGGLNVAPDTRQKQAIIKNGIKCMKSLGTKVPRVALLAATEEVNPAMPVTTDAQALARWAETACPDALVDGPLALDLAMSRDALQSKGIVSRLDGRADLWVVPSIECANISVKALLLFGKSLMAGVVMGARVPLVLTSRADQPASKLVSLAVAAALVTG
ncbi:MAG: phosphate acyltransferase [Bacillota bacterium]